MQLTPLIRKYLTKKNVEAGYKKRGDDTFCINQVGSDFEYHISYNFATYSWGRSIAPYLILWSPQHERLWLEMFGESKTKYDFVSLFHLNIGEIRRTFSKLWPVRPCEPWYSMIMIRFLYNFHGYDFYREWFYKEKDIPRKCDRMMRRIQKEAMPFFEKISNLETLIALYERKAVGTWATGFDLPLLYLQAGKKEKGIAYMNRSEWKKYMEDEKGKLFYENYCKYEYHPM